MRVLVIGALGHSAWHVMNLLLARGHEVTAFVGPSAALRETDPRLRVARGDASDARSIERAVENHDSVIACFEPRIAMTGVQEVLRRNLAAAMAKQGVKRLVNLLS